MQRFYSEREMSGPEFDDSLIRLVRANPAIYDVNHPHYRRNPVRVAIWDRIAIELGASSKFLQTKWKNIRYNYLQEVKCMETGYANPNIRKRRFTEDLSFLQNTAQSYNVKKGISKNSSYNSSDNESNSYMYPDQKIEDAFEIIEIDHSDDGGGDERNDDESPRSTKADTTTVNDTTDNGTKKKMSESKVSEPTPDVTIEQTSKRRNESFTPPEFYSNPSSPLLTPMIVMGNGQESDINGGGGGCNEVTIEPIYKTTKSNKRAPSSTDIMANAAKRKSMPDLTPINDPIELYCLSLVDSLRNMPRSERERVKFEFAKILKDATYKDQS